MTRAITRSTAPNIIPLNSPSLPIVIPPIYGLKGVGFETFTGDGPISYWNSYVGVGQMGGKGNFSDPRIGLFIKQTPDLVTPKLRRAAGLPIEPAHAGASEGQFRSQGRERGKDCSRARPDAAHAISRRHFTDVLSGRDRQRAVPARSSRSRDGSRICRRGRQPASTGQRRCADSLQHAPYFHDGSAPDLPRGRQSLRCAVRARIDGPAEGGSCRVSEVAVARNGSPESEQRTERGATPFTLPP